MASIFSEESLQADHAAQKPSTFLYDELYCIKNFRSVKNTVFGSFCHLLDLVMVSNTQSVILGDNLA